MVYLKNEFYDKTLLVNRIKCKDTTFYIHVNFVDEKRVNGWIKITDNMTLHGLDGNEMEWGDLVDGQYYQITFTRPERESVKEMPQINAQIYREFF